MPKQQVSSRTSQVQSCELCGLYVLRREVLRGVHAIAPDLPRVYVCMYVCMFTRRCERARRALRALHRAARRALLG
jgi:hypothetical protein